MVKKKITNNGKKGVDNLPKAVYDNRQVTECGKFREGDIECS